MSKSAVTNFVALLLVVLSFFVDDSLSKYFYFTGLFALSGAITNQIAIYMIFHKVPFIYGSGVIELNFEKFKASLKHIVMSQFFEKERVKRYLLEGVDSLDLEPLIKNTNFDPAFDALKKSLMESKYSGLINMIGGEDALEPLRATFSNKISNSILSITSSDSFKKQLEYYISDPNIMDNLIQKIGIIIDSRLQELSAKEVKDLVNSLIKEHLEWLVVWGGVFGGLIGFLSTLIYLH